MFPSPRRGPIFSTLRETFFRMLLNCFRPHEGDPSSLQRLVNNMKKFGYWFPSPRRGPIFSTGCSCYCWHWTCDCFRPHEGDPSSLRKIQSLSDVREVVSVPTKGTHLLYANVTFIRNWDYVSVPTKGTHLLY